MCVCIVRSPTPKKAEGGIKEMSENSLIVEDEDIKGDTCVYRQQC
jgi:hypothetical protein